MRAILIPVGSHGDVHPFVGLGARLRQRGHDVLILTNAHFRDMSQRAGLRFVELGTEEDYQRLIAMPQLWDPARGWQTVFREGLNPMLRPMYDRIIEHHLPGRTILIGGSLALAARVAREKPGIPAVTMHLQPGVVRSSIEPPRYPGLIMPRWLPRAVKDAMWAAGDRWVVDPLATAELNALRADLGLPPVKRVLDRWWHSPDLVLGMWPDWYARPQADWPAQLHRVGFPLFDEQGQHALPPAVERFLAEGDPPLAFTAGSAMVHGQNFFAAAVEACQRLGRRGLLLTRFHEQLPRSLPASVMHVRYAPFSELLPRVAGLAHHGGIGTTAQALAAGVPQLVMPMAHDQFDNAARIERLGVGASLPRKRFTAARVAAAFARLLGSPAVTTQCRTCADRLRGTDALSAACELVEQRYARKGERQEARERLKCEG